MFPIPFSTEPIIVYHKCTDYCQIPDHWSEQAKSPTLHYAHTSYGSQITSGISNLESLYPKYNVTIRVGSSAGCHPASLI